MRVRKSAGLVRPGMWTTFMRNSAKVLSYRGLLVGHVALLLESLQAGIVRVELKGAVQKIWTENLQSVHDGESSKRCGG